MRGTLPGAVSTAAATALSPVAECVCCAPSGVSDGHTDNMAEATTTTTGVRKVPAHGTNFVRCMDVMALPEVGVASTPQGGFSCAPPIRSGLRSARHVHDSALARDHEAEE